MYKPPKREDLSTLNKVRMPVAEGMPPSQQMKAVLDECLKKKGMQIEQAWTTSVATQKFWLIAQLMDGTTAPVWTLYEENAGSSKMHWSQPFEPADFSMMYDVICMSAPDAGATTKIPDSLKPNTDKAGGPSSGSSSAKPASALPSPAGGSGYPAPGGGSAYPSPGAGSGYPSPASPAAGGYPAPGAAPGYPAPPAVPYNAPPPNPYPGGYPPYPAAAPPPPPPPPPAPYPQQQPYPLNAPNPWQQGYAPPPAPYPGQAPAPPAPPAGQSSYSSSPAFTAQIQTADAGTPVVDYGLLSQRANILLGELMFEAGLITEPTLEAALKIQEFVREERMSPTQACEILKKHHSLGGSIDNYLSPDDFDLDSGNKSAAKRPPSFTSALKSASAGTSAAKGSSGTSSGSKPAGGKTDSSSSSDLPKSEKIKLQLASFDLLQKAGMLKNDDLQTAHAIYKKHGGDIVQMLTAAGKLDATTYKAAECCIPLIQENKMKVEQCIIALNYCQRSRVDFDSALDELGWENPRKKR